MGNIGTLQDIFAKLNLTEDTFIRLSDKNWKERIQVPNRVNRFLEKITPDAFFYLDNKPLILFFDNPKNKKKLHKLIWNFNETPIVIIIENNNIEIFNGFRVNESGVDKGFLFKIGNYEKLDDFSYFKLVTGKTWETYQNELTYKNRVDNRLLTNIKDARELILKKFPKTKSEKTKKHYSKITNALLGKVIFVRYLIDREVILNFNKQSKTWTNDNFCELLKNPKKAQSFFNYLADKETGFNGDLFTIEKNEYSIIPDDAYTILIQLLRSHDMGTGQLSLFDLYDFSVIPIEFISNVYESFLGIEKKEQEEDKKKNKKNDDGVHYTPLFLVDYILSETIDKRLAVINDTNCKVLDPACGSGVFLVETLRKLIEQYKKQNKQIYEDNKEKFKEDINNIAVKNIFGIDKDASAVQVAIFSVYLTLLDYLNPPEIKTFKFPELLGSNLFCADFFDKDADFNKKLDEKDFTFVIGNPPWMRGKNEKESPLYVTYIEDRKKEEEKKEKPIISIGNREIAQAFLLRTKDFSNVNTKCALIVTSKILYNLQSNDFRKYFLHNHLIERVFELAPVRREVFDKSNNKAIAPACILFFHYANGQNTDKNLIEHITLKPSRFFSMFKIFTINRHDIKTVQQNRLKEYDWLWKILVYGSYLDFNFIKRLKENYKSIEEYINNKNKFIIKQGIKKIDGKKKIDVSELIGWKFIDTNRNSKNLQPYYIMPDLKKWDENEVGYIHREKGRIVKNIFMPPALLIKDGLTSDFKTVAAMLNTNGLFTDNVTSVKALTPNSGGLLANILLLLCSELNSYWALLTASFVGIKQERSHDSEKFGFPFIQISNSEKMYEKINLLKENLYNPQNVYLSDYNQTKIKKEIDDSISEIDRLIYDIICLDPIEEALINYAKDITVPSIKYKYDVTTVKTDKEYLIDYADLFIERFKSSFDSVGIKFVVEIWHTQQIIGMFFKVVSKSKYKQDITWTDKQNDESGVMQTIIALSSEKITDKLFIQKDIRGFQKDYFYIFKPNEKRLWHKAVGYLDIYEFADVILQTGRDSR